MQSIKKKKTGLKEFRIPDLYNPMTIKSLLPVKESYTYKDYVKLPEGAPYQLIGGELIMTPSPTPYHQEISRKLEFLIQNFLLNNDLGRIYHAPLDVLFTDIEIYQPNIIFISNERKGIIGKKRIEDAPNVVIEILSPSTAYYDMRKKFSVCEKQEVEEYWIVDPGLKKVEISTNCKNKFKLLDDAQELGAVSSNVLKGLTINLSEIF